MAWRLRHHDARRHDSATALAHAQYEFRSGGIIDTLKAKAACLTSNMREPFKRGNWSMQPGVNK